MSKVERKEGELIPEAQIVERGAIEAMERAQIDIQISTANRYPKHTSQMMSKVKEDMLTLACLDEETASSCFYTLPRGGKSIQGPSVRMAEIALTCYGNARVAARIIDIDTTSDNPNVVVQAMSHDLERNIAFTAEKRRRITKKKRNDLPDEDDINLAVNACTAIAFRDAIFKMVPMALIKPVVEEAKKIAVGNVKSLANKRVVVFNKLRQMGANPQNILHVVGCRKIEDITVENLEVLIGLGTALKDGDVTLEEAFPDFKEQSDDAQKRNIKDTGSVVSDDPFGGKDTEEESEEFLAEE